MERKEALVTALQAFELDDLTTEWSTTCWENDFIVDTPPEDLVSRVSAANYYRDELSSALIALGNWLSEEGDDGQAGDEEANCIWSVLVESSISVKEVIALCYYILDTGTKRLGSAEQRVCAGLAATLCLRLVRTPGSGAFKLFRSTLFQQAVDTLKMWRRLQVKPTKKKRKTTNTASQKSSQRGRGRGKRGRARQPEEGDVSDDEAAGEEGGEDADLDSVLGEEDIELVHRVVLDLLKELIRFLQSFSLKDYGDLIYYVMQALAELCRSDVVNDDCYDPKRSLDEIDSIGSLVFHAMATLCSSRHGNESTLYSSLCKHQLPALLMLTGEGKTAGPAALSAHVVTVRDRTQDFLKSVLTSVGQPMHESVYILIQHLCSKVADKTDYRQKVAQTAVELLQLLPAASHARLVRWLQKFSRVERVADRSMALDLLAALVLQPPRQPEGLESSQHIFLTREFLIQTLLARCSDVSPSIRSRALQLFGSCVTSEEGEVRQLLYSLFTPAVATARAQQRCDPTPQNTRPASAGAAADLGSASADGSLPVVSTAPPCLTRSEQSLESAAPPPPASSETPYLLSLPPQPGITPTLYIPAVPEGEISLVDSSGVLSMLRRRAGDKRPGVRKAALQALAAVTSQEGAGLVNEDDLQVLRERCRDPALSVRKQAAGCLTDLLRQHPLHRAVQSAWLAGVVPMVTDKETTAQEKALQTLCDVIVRQIVAHDRSLDQNHVIAWALLGQMASEEGHESRHYLHKACHLWSRSSATSVLTSGLVKALKSHVGREHNEAAWMMLAICTPFVGRVDPSFVLDYWFSAARSADDDLKAILMKFDSPLNLIQLTVNALGKVCEAQIGCAKEANAVMEQWFADLLAASDSYLSDVVLTQREETVDEKLVICHLFTLGEISQRCPSRTPRRVLMLVQSLIAMPPNQQDAVRAANQKDGDNQPSGPGSDVTQAEGNVCTQGGGPTGSQWSQQVTWSQPGTQVFNRFQGKSLSPEIRAQAFTTLGKLSLIHDDVARRCVPAMARELDTSDDVTVRNNIMVVLCDLCIRYTAMVERYIENIAACLRDPAPIIRKQTLNMLTRLLQEDFLKWKGPLFYRFIVTIQDENKEIREFAEFCLVHLLKQRHPGMFYHHFVECIFHFNQYQGHKTYNVFPQSDKDKQQFSLKGKQNFEKRLYIYKFLLENMSDKNRFDLTTKLVHDVLGEVVDGVLALDADMQVLVVDTLAVLACKEMKLSQLRMRGGAEEEEEDLEKAATAAIQKDLITRVLKQNAIENIVPTVVSLKHMLEKERSPVLKHLMLYLRELVKDYKNEVKEVLAADRQLAKEIEFDLRRFEEAEKGRRQSGLPPRTPGRTPQRTSSSSPRAGTPNRSPANQRSATPTAANQKSPLAGGSEEDRPPRTPRTPHTPHTPRSAAGSPQGTPRRIATLAQAAILNSARKRMESRTKTPTQNQSQSRAISTPSQTLSDITFAQGNNTLLPPSPINTDVPQAARMLCRVTLTPMNSDRLKDKWGIQSPVILRGRSGDPPASAPGEPGTERPDGEPAVTSESDRSATVRSSAKRSL